MLATIQAHTNISMHVCICKYATVCIRSTHSTGGLSWRPRAHLGLEANVRIRMSGFYQLDAWSRIGSSGIACTRLDANNIQHTTSPGGYLEILLDRIYRLPPVKNGQLCDMVACCSGQLPGDPVENNLHKL